MLILSRGVGSFRAADIITIDLCNGSIIILCWFPLQWFLIDGKCILDLFPETQIFFWFFDEPKKNTTVGISSTYRILGKRKILTLKCYAE